MQKSIVIIGPTTSDKSAFAVSLAKKFNGEIISVDSRQVYRGLGLFEVRLQTVVGVE